MSRTYQNFEEFFKVATGHEPYPYQIRLAESNIPDVLNIPTGAGKTEAAILSLWLWRRENNDKNTPTRLIYCLPMRVLVEQTVKRVRTWLSNLDLDEIGVAYFMGGDIDEDFLKHPTKDYLIIGTQDMLVSGALNRAYGKNPYSWPRFFGLFNNDSMWIMDEVQIMENALPTSRQLDAFRNQFATYGSQKTVWMSATLNKNWLSTVDAPINMLDIFELNDQDKNNKRLQQRNNANKTLHKLTFDSKYNKKTITSMINLHKKGTITLIMANTVDRAQTIYDLIARNGYDCKLIHSRFRQGERNNLNELIEDLKEDSDMIIVSTQVLEAGIDISASTLITEIAPWPNLIQRFGRCNRRGELSNADIYWIDIDDKSLLPYEKRDIDYARTMLENYNERSLAPDNLPEITTDKIFDSVLRRKDLMDLFDNTSDLSGSYVDASRFVRSAEQSLDVEVFWRETLSKDMTAPHNTELCSVSISDIKEFMKNHSGMAWDYTQNKWIRVKRQEIFPGQTIALDAKSGGYSKLYGWKKDSKEKVESLDVKNIKNDSNDTDHQSMLSNPVTLEDHTRHVLDEIDEILKNLKFDIEKDAIRTAVKYHDTGKIHPVFQNYIQKGITKNNQSNETIWAKSERQIFEGFEIPGFRHEAVSALAYLKNHNMTENKLVDNLIAYLIMSHHGKVRLALRNIRKYSGNNQYILGIKKDGDRLDKFTSTDLCINKTEFNMSLAELGMNEESGPSWLERVLTLLDAYGPFRLAYMESLVRAADTIASEKEDKGEIT